MNSVYSSVTKFITFCSLFLTASNKFLISSICESKESHSSTVDSYFLTIILSYIVFLEESALIKLIKSPVLNSCLI